MEAELLSVLNPSYFHGRYPFDPDRHGEVPALSKHSGKKSSPKVTLNQSIILRFVQPPLSSRHCGKSQWYKVIHGSMFLVRQLSISLL